MPTPMAEEIVQLLVRNGIRKDSLKWCGNKNAMFTIKSVYQLETPNGVIQFYRV